MQIVKVRAAQLGRIRKGDGPQDVVARALITSRTGAARSAE